MNNDYVIRVAKPSDQDAIFLLVESVYAEYGYEASKTHGEADLMSLEESYFDKGGCFWVLESQAGVIRGAHAALPCNESVCTFRRLYLHGSLRGTSAGQELMKITIAWAKEHGFSRIEFWSDTKYQRAHRFFEKFGFTKTDQVRRLHDGLQPYQEYFCFLDL